jgi:hypothetical protein
MLPNVTTASAPHGTSGQKMSIPPTKSTRNDPKTTAVLMTRAPTQYPSSRSNRRPHAGQCSCRVKYPENALAPHLGQRRRKARPVMVSVDALGSRLTGPRLSSAR